MKLNLKNKKDIDDKVLRTIIQYGLGFASRVKTLEEKCIDDWKSDKLYDKSSFVIYDGYIWKAKVTNQSSTWDEKYWNKVGDELSLIELDDIKAMLNLTDEQLKTLSSLILDNEIRLDKTFSSSRIYSDIQQCLNNCKAFTLQELAKKTGASYKVVTATSEVTSTEFLYLISNSTAYDIYALIDGVARKIGDTTIDLSQFYTKTEIDNDFLKKADADSKFATITTVDGKVDKSSILSAISSTPSNDKLLSEKAINDTLVKKTDITTTIDSSSTDSELPTAKAVYTAITNPILELNRTFEEMVKAIIISHNSSGKITFSGLFYNTEEYAWTSYFATCRKFDTKIVCSGIFVSCEKSKIKYFRVDGVNIDSIKIILWE